MKVADELTELTNELSDSLQEEKGKSEQYLNQLLDTRHELVQQDYIVENQKQVIQNLKKTLELLTEENKHLKSLVGLWLRNK